MNLIIQEINLPSQPLSKWTAPLILVSTWITHLVGGSAGRESTGVQLGASLTDLVIKKITKVAQSHQEALLLGAGAGFGAAIGAPWAGSVFAFEFSKQRPSLALLCKALIASHCGYAVTQALSTPHMIYPQIDADISRDLILACFGAALCFALTVRLYLLLVKSVEWAGARTFRQMPFFALTAGALLCLGFFATGSLRYTGLGLDVIAQSFEQTNSFKDPLFKILFTALTLGSGFKGGEFTPLVFIGATLGSALSQWLPAEGQFLASLGAVSVFGIASNTPLTCTIMAAEFFGLEISPYAFLVLLVGCFFSGRSSIYESQLIYFDKYRWFNSLLKLRTKSAG